MRRKYSNPLVFSNILLESTGNIPIGQSPEGTGSNPNDGEWEDDGTNDVIVNPEANSSTEELMSSQAVETTGIDEMTENSALEENVLNAIMGEETSLGEGNIDN